METRAYIEGIRYRWWLLLLMTLIALVIGTEIGINQTAQYTASTSILLNDSFLANNAFPSNTIQISTASSYPGVAVSPAVIGRISQSYPRLTQQQLDKEILISIDSSSQVMMVNVTDVSPSAAADIANYVARHFVSTQIAHLHKQLDYYTQWLQQQTLTLNTEVNTLNQQIDTLAPQRQLHTPPPTLTPQQKLTYTQTLTHINLDQRKLYSYQQSQTEIQQVTPLINAAYIILQPATIPQVPNSYPLSTLTVQAIALLVGLLLAICTSIALDFFSPFIRHQGELVRLIGITPLAEVPQLTPYEQSRLLQSRTIPFMRRIKPVRLLCASISAMLTKQQGNTFLLTSPYKKRKMAAIVAMFLARKGLRTLLIDADFAQPTLHQQITATEPAEFHLADGQPLSFISTTPQSDLFFISASALFGSTPTHSQEILLGVLPALQTLFDVIIIDAPTLDHAASHQLAAKISQSLIFIKKRRDSMKTLHLTRTTCEQMKLEAHYILLA